jgi:hypothetical protein
MSYRPESGSEFERLLLLFAENELAAQDIERLGEILLGDRDACEYYARYVAIQAALEARQVHPPVILPDPGAPGLKLAAAEYPATRRAADHQQLGRQPVQGAGEQYADARPQPPAASPPVASRVLGFLGDIGRSGWPKYCWTGVSNHRVLLSVFAALLFVTAIAAVAVHRGAARRAPGPEQVVDGQMRPSSYSQGGSPSPSTNSAADQKSDFSNRESPQSPRQEEAAIPNAAIPPPAMQSVCLLTLARGVHWAEPLSVRAEMDRLAPGQEINILDGRVELTFDRGVRMVLEGPAHIRILGPLCVKAYSGNLMAHVGDSAHGFTVMTPRGNVVDLGTEFGLHLDASGAVQVAVFKGSVDVTGCMEENGAPTTRSPKTGGLQPSPPSATRRLVAGEALCMGATGGLSRLAAISSETFPCLSAPFSAPHGPPVIAAVSDDIRLPESAQFYEIVPGGLVEGAPAYVDRFYQWTGVTKAGIPEPLRGADYVRMFNSDKVRGDYQITVQLACAAELYVFTDDRRRSPPEWVRAQFQPTGWKIQMTERSGAATLLAKDPRFSIAIALPGDADRSFSVWRLPIGHAQTVTLGSAGEENGTYSMYGIAATATARVDAGSAAINVAEAREESFLRSPNQVHRQDPQRPTAHTVAYWRFEDRPLGNLAPDTQDNANPVRATTDSSYNGNDLYCYNTGLRPTFSGDVPAPVVPQSGMANRGCIAVTEPTEGGLSKREFYTHSQFSHASPVDVQKIEPAQWTIEASVKTKQLLHGRQVIVCRDGRPPARGESAGEAPRLILEINQAGRFSIRFADVQGRFHEACASQFPVEANRWYHLAAMSDGATLKLFVKSNDGKADDGRGYVLQASAELPKTPGLNGTGTALGKCSDDSEWALGRGREVNWEDSGWFQGWLDEVRISDTALEPADFLFAANNQKEQPSDRKISGQKNEEGER